MPRRSQFSRLLKLLWVKRSHVLWDITLLLFTFSASYQVRYEFSVPDSELAAYRTQLLFVPALQFGLLVATGCYSFIWRYIGLAEMRAFIVGVGASMALPLALRLMLPASLHEWRVPLSVTLINTVFAFGALVGSRVMRRVIYESFERKKVIKGTACKRVLLIGAGRAGLAMAEEMKLNGDTGLDAQGFVDDDPRKAGMVIHGLKVLGSVDDLTSLVRTYDIDHVVITMVKASRAELRRILDICERIPVAVKIIPSLWELLNDRLKVSRIRDFEIGDLLGRDPVDLNQEHVRKFFEGKCVMVTGAGGSIGSELVRQIACCNPGTLLLVERAEPALFQIEFELRRAAPDVKMVPLLVDVMHAPSLERVFATYRPQLILHAAAHKHVPLTEANEPEAVLNNVIATKLLGELAGRHEAEAVVLISTDKAVNPKSILGATKRTAELVTQDLNGRYNTRFLAVRFGNVIGSAGSVIPVFREQIRQGGPVTVTHADMVRFFMTIPEASQLVMDAMTMGQGGEIFILDMGEPVRILSLAEDVITLSGLRPYEDIDIQITGSRPGEKLYEELELPGECIAKTRHPKIFVGRMNSPQTRLFSEKVSHLEQMALAGDGLGCRRLLSELVPDAQLAGVSSAAKPLAAVVHAAAGSSR